jgi:hypothetical protein
MKERLDNLTIVQVALIIGIVYLVSQGALGWGWLVFALILTL